MVGEGCEQPNESHDIFYHSVAQKPIGNRTNVLYASMIVISRQVKVKLEIFCSLKLFLMPTNPDYKWLSNYHA